MLEEVQTGLLEQATTFRDANIVDVSSFDELRTAVEAGKWARGPWAGACRELWPLQLCSCLMLELYVDAVWRLASGHAALGLCKAFDPALARVVLVSHVDSQVQCMSAGPAASLVVVVAQPCSGSLQLAMHLLHIAALCLQWRTSEGFEILREMRAMQAATRMSGR